MVKSQSGNVLGNFQVLVVDSGEKNCKIVGYTHSDIREGGFVLGEYSSERKAREILEEIQVHHKSVYVMPGK